MKIILYTNSEYADVFQLTLHFIHKTMACPNPPEKIFLFSDYVPEGVVASLISVFLYDPAEPYAARLLSCVNDLTASGEVGPEERCLFSHDNDLLYHYDDGPFNALAEIMTKNGIDRVGFVPTVYSDPVQLWFRRDPLPFPAAEGCFLFKNPCFFSYNVGPGIWKLDAWLDILRRFPDKTYRTIESEDVINYTCHHHKIYNMHAAPRKHAGFNRFALPFFVFVHITSGGEFLNDAGSPYLAEMQELYHKYGLTRAIRHLHIH